MTGWNCQAGGRPLPGPSPIPFRADRRPDHLRPRPADPPHLRPEEFDKILTTLEHDAHGQQIAIAWIAKEKLRDIIRLRTTFTGHPPTPDQVRTALYDFFSWCADHDHIPEVLALTKTIDRWRNEIINAVLLGISNAKSEGLNRTIKLEGRKAYGYRNAVNQRRRTRYATTRATRRPPRSPTATNRRSHPVTDRQHDPG